MERNEVKEGRSISGNIEKHIQETKRNRESISKPTMKEIENKLKNGKENIISKTENKSLKDEGRDIGRLRERDILEILNRGGKI